MSVLSFAHLGSSLSIRGLFPMYSLRSISCYGALKFRSASNYIQQTTNDTEYISMYGHNDRALSMTSDGGTLHGTWSADVSISSSDRSLKTNIQSLEHTLQDGTSRPHTGVGGILRKLQPVSYTYKGSGAESTKTRFGFIADEMMDALPEITRGLPQKDEGFMGLVYQDLLAFLTAMLQGLAKDMSTAIPRLAMIEERIRQRKKWKRAKKQQARKKLALAKAASSSS